MEKWEGKSFKLSSHFNLEFLFSQIYRKRYIMQVKQKKSPYREISEKAINIMLL